MGAPAFMRGVNFGLCEDSRQGKGRVTDALHKRNLFPSDGKGTYKHFDYNR